MATVEIRQGREVFISFLAIALVAFRLGDVQRSISFIETSCKSIQQWLNLVCESLTDQEVAFIWEFFYRQPGGIPEELAIIFAAHPEAAKFLESPLKELYEKETELV